jgi:hypothetical protein
MTLAGADVVAACMAPASLALLSAAAAPQSLLVPLQPQPQPFAVSAAGAVSALAAVDDDAVFIAVAFCERIRPLGREEVEPSAALPEVLMAWRRARLILRASDAVALSA